jgi:hypothetical protein
MRWPTADPSGAWGLKKRSGQWAVGEAGSLEAPETEAGWKGGVENQRVGAAFLGGRCLGLKGGGFK